MDHLNALSPFLSLSRSSQGHWTSHIDPPMTEHSKGQLLNHLWLIHKSCLVHKKVKEQSTCCKNKWKERRIKVTKLNFLKWDKADLEVMFYKLTKPESPLWQSLNRELWSGWIERPIKKRMNESGKKEGEMEKKKKPFFLSLLGSFLTRDDRPIRVRGWNWAVTPSGCWSE